MPYLEQQNYTAMMDQTPKELFGLNVEGAAATHLAETAKWARFLAIAGFVLIGLIMLIMLVAGAFMSSFIPGMGGGMATGIFMIYALIIGAIWFFPALFTYRFASNMRRALAGNDQQALITAFQNLKITFRYIGIITIILVSIYALAFVFAGISAAFISR